MNDRMEKIVDEALEKRIRPLVELVAEDFELDPEKSDEQEAERLLMTLVGRLEEMRPMLGSFLGGDG